MTLTDLEWPFYAKFRFCQVQHLLIYLYGQRHDIYGVPSHLCMPEVVIIDIFMYIYGLCGQVNPFERTQADCLNVQYN